MGFHTFDADGADRLEEASRYRFLSREELIAALDPAPGDAVADVGSGTGFYTDDVAPYVGSVAAIDLQPEMHEYYREKGVPENVDLITAGSDDVPLPDDSLDGVFSTMTYHEYPVEDTIAEFGRLLRVGGRIVIADWSANGEGAAGPPVDERYAASDAAEALTDGELEPVRVVERPETFLVVARAP
ncbi:class I SAM-dependent methyltransferase [Halorubrum sp. DTA98]|uniref:class I SAM-dependent methyltransferase n=1 Tax=Halorubrum sp. DTA98 TaxID=3402163 RepID=UPI003AB00CCA